MDIHELRLKAHCLADLRKFYGDQLGFPLHEADRDSFTLKAGATRLVFEQASGGERWSYHFAFNIPGNQFSEAKAWLKERAALLPINEQDEIHWTAWNAHAVYFFDPAGNVVELIARHSLDEKGETPFSAESISRVSEIGLAVENVADAAQALRSDLGLEVWDAGDGEVFTALGDEHGLLIVVRKGRSWFPTSDRSAGLAPAALTIYGTVTREYRLDGLPYLFKVIKSA